MRVLRYAPEISPFIQSNAQLDIATLSDQRLAELLVDVWVKVRSSIVKFAMLAICQPTL